MALCKLEMFNLAINADDLFYFFKIFEVVKYYMKIMDENCRVKNYMKDDLLSYNSSPCSSNI